MWGPYIPRAAAAEPTRYPWATTKGRFTVEVCCHEQHAWWVVAGATFLSTWNTEAEAIAEARRLNEENATLNQAVR